MKSNKQYYGWINRILKTLRTDESIIITRPDKGRGIVIMYRADYVQKMESILQDQTKFKRISEDPTLINEGRLDRLLSRLLKEEFITPTEHYIARPIGSRAARLYGLPKTHKQNYPLRPVMSAIKTVGYGLGKLLTYRLSHLRLSPYVLRDTADFLKKIKMSTNADMTMVSFDVVSLFTNVPLAFTINYILDQMYPVCPKNCLRLSRSKKCVKCKHRTDFKALLRTATSDTNFTFNNQMYVQVDGVAMGAPLAPVMADIFMVYLETTLMDRLLQAGVCEWYRYVDDTFVLVNPSSNINDIITILNSFHASIQFTHNIEPNNALEFLDVYVKRILKDQQYTFETTTYRKPTFTGLLTNWHSYVPLSYKRASIVSMVNRALTNCSNYTTLDIEFNKIRQIAVNNDYPLTFIDSIIKARLCHYFNKSNENTCLPMIGCDKKRIYVEIPYVSSLSNEFKKRIQHLTTIFRPDLDIRFYCKPPPSIQMSFQIKDPIVKYMKSDVVYLIKCSNCDHFYIGKTERQPIRRLIEHGATKTAFGLSTPIPDVVLQPIADNLRRSSRIRNKTQAKTSPTTSTTTTTAAAITDINDGDTVWPAVKQHEIDTGHQMNWSDFSIVCQDNIHYRLLIRESLLIKAHNPELNRTTHSVPIVVFPDGLPESLLPKL